MQPTLASENWSWRLTAAHLVRAIHTVFLSIAQEFLGDAAVAVCAAMLAALGWFPAVQFVRLVPTLRLPITHLSPRDAHLPVGALELTWGGVQIKGTTI